MISLLTNWKYKSLQLKGAWHLCYYISTERQSIGSLPHSIIQFKENNSILVNKWCNWAVNELMETKIKFDYVIRALGSKELRPSGVKALDKLGALLSQRLACQYIPQVLGKTRETFPMHTVKTRDERQSMMKGAYYVFDKQNNLNHKNVLILDDVTTSSTTIKEILRALRKEWPHGNYYFFCLGQTAYEAKLNESINLDYFE